jgi:diaminopimelate decarboxylase
MEIQNKKYVIDEVPVLALVKKYGTPLYVYDTSKMRSQYKRLQKAFRNTNIRIYYACKALTNVNILRFFRDLGAGLDAVSIQEVRLSLLAGFDPKDILYTPNCVSLDEIDEAVKLGVRVNIDNISILEQFGHKYGSTIPICIRINPHIMAGANHKISTGHIDSKFGISIYQMPHVERVIQTNGMKVEGLHMHTGSDILDIDVFLKGVEILLETARSLPDLDYIDIGSGFKVAYHHDDIFTDVDAFGKSLSKQFNQFCKEYGKELTLIFEPGKFLVSEAGYFIARVNVVKQTLSTVFAGLDTGMNHLIRPMFYDAYHQIINVSKTDGKTRIYTVVGYICETDTFGWNRKLTEISEGDYLAFLNAGAYCFTMASNYNSRYKPAEVMIHKKKDYLIRQRENFDDLTRNQVIPEELF